MATKKCPKPLKTLTFVSIVRRAGSDLDCMNRLFKASCILALFLFRTG